MQTRKRAKSVTFGKKAKEKEKESPKEPIEEKTAAAAIEKEEEKVEEKADIKDTEQKTEEPENGELSSSLPKTEEAKDPEDKEEKEEKEKSGEKEEKEEATDVTTPKNEFITESPLSATPETSKPEVNETPGAAEGKASEGDKTPADELPKPIETPTQTDTSPQSASSQEQTVDQALSPTPPQSAFTIQSNDSQTQAPPVEGKKKFGLYFFIIAFLSFVLGLGAIAGANYFGIIKLSIPQLPTAAPATPTLVPTVPPTVAPTSAKVDLSAYTISVLNGSTIAGKAAAIKESLTASGYKVGTVGNADNSNYTKTEIAAKSTVDKAYLSKLQEQLKKSFVVDSTIGTLPASSSSDVTVTLGAQAAQ